MATIGETSLTVTARDRYEAEWESDRTWDHERCLMLPRCDFGRVEAEESFDYDLHCAMPRRRGAFCKRHATVVAAREGEYRGERVPRAAGCEVAGCGAAVLAKGLCSKHYRRRERGQSLVRADERSESSGVS